MSLLLIRAGILFVTSEVTVLLGPHATVLADEWSVLGHMTSDMRVQILVYAVRVVTAIPLALGVDNRALNVLDGKM
jgi:hypothetical protein